MYFKFGLLLITLIIISISNAWLEDDDVRKYLYPYITVDTLENQDLKHGQYGFLIYGPRSYECDVKIPNSGGGSSTFTKMLPVSDTPLFAKFPITSQAPESYKTFDIGMHSYYAIDYDESEKGNNVILTYADNNAKKSDTYQVPLYAWYVKQAIWKEYDTPFHSEAMILKQLDLALNDAEIPDMTIQESAYLYTQNFPCAICTAKLASKEFVNSRRADYQLSKKLNGFDYKEVQPINYNEQFFSVEANYGIKNRLIPQDTDKQHSYLSFSRQWDNDYCHYNNMLQLYKTYQIVTTPINRHKFIVGTAQEVLLEFVLGSTKLFNLKDNDPYFRFNIKNQGQDAQTYAFQYMINDAFRYFYDGKIENFRSFLNWQEFLGEMGYPEAMQEVMKNALDKFKQKDCKWSQSIYRLMGVKGSKNGMPIKRTVIPIAPPQNLVAPTCAVNNQRFPCKPIDKLVNYKVSPKFLNYKYATCEIYKKQGYEDQFGEVLVASSGMSLNEQQNTDLTKFKDEKISEFITNFEKFYYVRRRGDKLRPCAQAVEVPENKDEDDEISPEDTDADDNAENDDVVIDPDLD